MEERSEELILIDGNSLLNRAFYGVPPLTTRDGTPAGAVFGFTNMLVRLIEKHNPRYVAAAFDRKAKTFRHLAYAGYKATRHPMPEELAVQLPLLKDLLGRMGIRIIEQDGIEADDIIGTMALNSGVKTFIVTGDRDSFQLVDDRTTVLFTKRGITEVDEITPESLKRITGLTPAQIIDYKALAGDSSDNIPGVPGVGEKTAVGLLEKYGSLKGVYENLDSITGALHTKLEANRPSAEISYYLATIKRDCDIDTSVSLCEYEFPFGGEVFDFFVKMEFKALIKRENLFKRDVGEERKAVIPTLVEIKSANQAAVVLNGVSELAVDFGDNVSISFDEKTVFVFLVRESLFGDGMTYDEAIDVLRSVLEDERVVKYVYDVKKVAKDLSPYGVNIKNCEDVALMDYLIRRNFKYGESGDVAALYGLGKEYTAAMLLKEAKSALGDLKENGMSELYSSLELPLSRVLFEMEKTGFKIDTVLLKELEKKYDAEEKECLSRIYALAGKEFNVNSPKQLAKVLFEDLRLYNPNKGSGQSTSAEILEKIRNSHPVVREILRYRFISKLKSTYIEGLDRLVGPGGYVHTAFNQMLTSTGRLSSSKPNLQNIPVREEEGKALRKLFIPSDGNVLVSADYSQIELRIMAHLSGDKNLVAAYERGADIHSAVASELFSTVNPTSEERRIAKTVNFGIIYGMSAFGLSEELGISPTSAKQYIDTYFARYPGVKRYTEKAVEDARKKGYGESLLGRRRAIPELFSSNYNERTAGERAAMNMPLQSSAADVIKLAMLKVHSRLKGMNSRLVLQIHDELVIDADVNELAEVKEILRSEMEGAVKLRVPLVVDVKSGFNLAECK